MHPVQFNVTPSAREMSEIILYIPERNKSAEITRVDPSEFPRVEKLFSLNDSELKQ